MVWLLQSRVPTALTCLVCPVSACQISDIGIELIVHRTVIDGTPRDCATPGCGAEADTSIIRQNELGGNKASALGRTKGGGPVDAAAAISMFMTGSSSGSSSQRRGLLDGLLGGGTSFLPGCLHLFIIDKSIGKSGGSNAATSQGTSTKSAPVEGGVKAAAGTGATSGLPTCSDNGTITLTYHQVSIP